MSVQNTKSDRKRELESALRENLKKRKNQARKLKSAEAQNIPKLREKNLSKKGDS